MRQRKTALSIHVTFDVRRQIVKQIVIVIVLAINKNDHTIMLVLNTASIDSGA